MSGVRLFRTMFSLQNKPPGSNPGLSLGMGKMELIRWELLTVLRISTSNWAHGREGNVRTIRHPIDPPQLLDIRNASRDAIPSPEILIRRQGRRIHTAGARDPLELRVDHGQLVLPDLRRPVRHAVVYPRAIARRRGSCGLVYHVVRCCAVACVIGTPGLSARRDGLLDVAQLCYVL